MPKSCAVGQGKDAANGRPCAHSRWCRLAWLPYLKGGSEAEPHLRSRLGRPAHLLKVTFPLIVFACLCSALAQAQLSPTALPAHPLDQDADGYPDAAEIQDSALRRTFMNWFASVAEAQYLRAAPDWQARDCSGLLRYAFIKALKPKTAAWRRSLPGRFGALPSTHLALYPMPYISRSVFRRAPGSYRLTDVAEGKLVGEASAYELMRYSSVYLGKDARAAVRGDLLFFVHPLASGSAYHSMVYLGNGRVVYHTGLSPGAGGRVKLVTLSALRQHPDPSWSPEAKNPSFLGFYRWKIVDSSLAP